MMHSNVPGQVLLPSSRPSFLLWLLLLNTRIACTPVWDSLPGSPDCQQPVSKPRPLQAKKAKAASGASGKPPSIPAAGLTSEEAAKRAARQERFAAPLATGPSTAAPNLKPAEEADPAPPTAPTGSAMDKLAARAARFGSGAAPAQATV